MPARRGANACPRINDGAKLRLYRETLYEDIARRLFARQTASEIAVAVGLTKQDVYYILRHPDFKPIFDKVRDKLYDQIDDALRDNRADMVDRITALQPVAFKQLVSMIEQGHGTNGTRPSERARMEAIKFGMGLGGHVPVEKRLVAEIPVARLPDEQLRQLVGVFARAERRTGEATAEVVTVNAAPEPT